jgi:hypothetical protein
MIIVECCCLGVFTMYNRRLVYACVMIACADEVIEVRLRYLTFCVLYQVACVRFPRHTQTSHCSAIQSI